MGLICTGYGVCVCVCVFLCQVMDKYGDFYGLVRISDLLGLDRGALDFSGQGVERRRPRKEQELSAL